MNFDFSEDQYALRDAARSFFAGECSPGDVREAWASDTGRNPDRWAKMAKTGFVGLTVPEEHGGLGLDDIDLVLILEEAGAAALPEPLLETTGIGVPLLVEAGTSAQQTFWLPRIAAGEAIVTVQLGGSSVVPDAHIADLAILRVDGQLHAVPRESFSAVAQPSMDGARRLFTVDADTSDRTRMEGDGDAADKGFDRGAAGTAAMLCGLAQRLLDLTVAYASQRHQFGRPIGSFQAVKHKLAETLVAAEMSRPAAWYAAYAIAADLPDRSEAASVAKCTAAEAAHKANYEALQCHGGIGFTWEHDLHLWLKRGKALEQAYGSARSHRARLAEELFSS